MSEFLTLTVEFHSVWRTQGLRWRQAYTFPRIKNQMKKTTGHTPEIYTEICSNVHLYMLRRQWLGFYIVIQN